jgi:hypothetical protein
MPAMPPQPADDPTSDPHGWAHPSNPPRGEDLLAPSTQIVGDRDAYLGQGAHDVGRRVSDDEVELFVAGDAGPSLQIEIERHQAAYVAVHDIGTAASLRLLGSLANAAKARVQRLSIRRQGHGVPLAVLQFVEIVVASGERIRVYSTDANADGHSRVQLTRVLLANSQLGVLLVGELPAHALATSLMPLADALHHGPWPNRELLFIPLGSGSALAQQASRLQAARPIQIQITPRANKPRQAWNFIAGAWNRLQGPGSDQALPVDLNRAVERPVTPAPLADTEPMQLRSDPLPISAPSVPPRPMPLPGQTRWQGYVDRCAQIKGAVAACVFDVHSLAALAVSGGPPPADRLAQQGALLLGHFNDTARALGLGATRVEGTISTQAHHLLLRPVPGHPGVALHLVLLAASGNPTLARMQLERIESPA